MLVLYEELEIHQSNSGLSISHLWSRDVASRDRSRSDDFLSATFVCNRDCCSRVRPIAAAAFAGAEVVEFEELWTRAADHQWTPG